LESPWSGLASLAFGSILVIALTRALWIFSISRYSSASS
jgi:ABC-type uncharacterized transport system permease subunit